MKNIFKKAHQMTKEIKREYPEVSYQAQFGLCLSFLLSEKEEEVKEMKTKVFIKTGKKQVAADKNNIVGLVKENKDCSKDCSIVFMVDDMRVSLPKVKLHAPEDYQACRELYGLYRSAL
jgi:hypothetical protein